MHAELSQSRQGISASGYPHNSHTNIFDHITTYGDSTHKDPEMTVPQWFPDMNEFKIFIAVDFAATVPATRDS